MKIGVADLLRGRAVLRPEPLDVVEVLFDARLILLPRRRVSGRLEPSAVVAGRAVRDELDAGFLRGSLLHAAVAAVRAATATAAGAAVDGGDGGDDGDEDDASTDDLCRPCT